MKYHECHKTRKPVGRLPLFPSPYPGESIYSLLCRYHVRSGNVNDRYTIRQLFGYNSSLGSTLLSPYHLEKAKKWLGSGASISTETLLQKNTAFPLFSVTAAEYELSRICDMISGKVESTTYPRWVQIRLLHPSRRLRYCPECAAAQEKLYGEAYWQVLPQLDGVEYCPVHGIRIKNSTVSLEDIRRAAKTSSQNCSASNGRYLSVWHRGWTGCTKTESIIRAFKKSIAITTESLEEVTTGTGLQ